YKQLLTKHSIKVVDYLFDQALANRSNPAVFADGIYTAESLNDYQQSINKEAASWRDILTEAIHCALENNFDRVRVHPEFHQDAVVDSTGGGGLPGNTAGVQASLPRATVKPPPVPGGAPRAGTAQPNAASTTA